MYRALLRLYPAEFRDEYGREMTQLVRDRAPREPAGRFWLDVAADLARTAPKEHLHVLMNDLRYAARMMRRAPLFTAAVVLTVALAIAANTAIFSVVNAVMLRPLPFAEPDRLMQVAEKNDRLNITNFSASVLNFLAWREQTQTFEGLAAMGFSTFTLTGGGEPEQLAGNRISPALMRVLGLSPIAGRAFTDAEEKPGGDAVAMISEGLWRRRFGADASIVGRSVTLNGAATTVVGIAPAALNQLAGGAIYTPLVIDPAKEIRLNHVIFVAGRLKAGVSRQQAQSEMDAIASRVGSTYPEMKDWGISLVSFFDTFVSAPLATGLIVLLAAVGFVLLIACANIANLLLARAAARQKEIAVRTAMGASRTRLLRQLLVESLALSIVGGGLGIAGAIAAVPAINASLPPNLLPVSKIPVDGTVLAFALALTVMTGVLFGVAPAWHAARADVNDMLKQSGRGAGGSMRARLRNTLAAAELALATVLLIGAGLLIQTLLNLQRAHLGFEPNGVITFQLAPPPSAYPLDSKAPLFYRTLIQSLEAAPGVRAAAVSSGIPLGVGNYTRSPMMTLGQSVLPADTAVPIDWRIVSPGYFKTMNIPLVRGRTFTEADGPSAPVIIVSQATAKKFWGDGDPIGRQLRRPAGGPPLAVIGVVGDVRSNSLNQEFPTLYYPTAARVWPLMDVVVRADGSPESLLPLVRQKVHDLDAGLALANVRTMEGWVSNSAAQPRLNATLLGVFAAVALLIAAIGIYGVLAYSVNQRTREIGLRMALGAQPTTVVQLVVREGMTVGIVGIGAGLAAGLALNRAVASLVYGVRPNDPSTFIVVAVVLGTVALGACAIPAGRAARVNPIVALRDE